MIEIKDKALCCGCSACQQICPNDCISMQKDNEGFWYPNIDLSKCTNCGMCSKVCYMLESNKKKSFNSKAYAAYNNDELILNKSSSGGIFSILAEEILSKGGCVFGASFDINFQVQHIMIENKEELFKLRGSKYVQSDIAQSFVKVREELKKGRLVYFSGTPCQIDSLLKYLGKVYDNLITQDIICHGVPSPLYWEEYLNLHNEKYAEKPTYINFREKIDKWENYELLIKYKTNKYCSRRSKDTFFTAFLDDKILRPSCYSCHSKGLYRNSDITLADFWGIKDVDSSMYNSNGTSLVVVHSNRGLSLLFDCQEKMIMKEENLDDAIKYNKSMINSPKTPKERKQLSKVLNNYKKYNSNFVKKNYFKIIKKRLSILFK